MCHEEVRGGGKFLEDLVRGGFEAGSAAGWERFGKCLHDRAEGDGEALHKVAGPDVAVHRISNEFADDHWGFAMVGQGSEGSERKVRDHGAEGRRDFAIEVGVFGKETLIAKCFKTIQDGRETQDGIELGIIKQRVLRLEGLLDGKKPAISFPPLGMIELAGRLEEVEANCSRLASDSFAAVESMHQKLDEVSNSFPQAWKEDFAEFDKRISNTLNESISKIAGVMSKLVDAQKSLRKNRASTSIQPVALIDRQEALEGLYQEIQYLRQRERHN